MSDTPSLHPQAARLAELEAELRVAFAELRADKFTAALAALVAECDAQRERIQELEAQMGAPRLSAGLVVEAAETLITGLDRVRETRANLGHSTAEVDWAIGGTLDLRAALTTSPVSPDGAYPSSDLDALRVECDAANARAQVAEARAAQMERDEDASIKAELEREIALRARVAELEQALAVIADAPCAVFPHPAPSREGDRLIWPSNCVTQKREPCASCRARAALRVGQETAG